MKCTCNDWKVNQPILDGAISIASLRGYSDGLKWFCGTDKKKDLPDKERYKTMVRIDPWGELVEFECECKSYKFNKGLKLCKHLSGTSEPGILQILKKWEEIDRIPKIKDLEPIK